MGCEVVDIRVIGYKEDLGFILGNTGIVLRMVSFLVDCVFRTVYVTFSEGRKFFGGFRIVWFEDLSL